MKGFDHIDHDLLIERVGGRIGDLKGDANDRTVLECRRAGGRIPSPDGEGTP